LASPHGFYAVVVNCVQISGSLVMDARISTHIAALSVQPLDLQQGSATEARNGGPQRQVKEMAVRGSILGREAK
jgi:hypothetical protein